MEYILGRSRPLIPGDSRHGKYSTYMNHKCRCDLCKKANASYRLLKKYGISMKERDAMIALQGGCCASCGDTFAEASSRQIHVDHSHVTGAVRGILCHGCNVSLGLMRDDPHRIRGLLAYAEHHSITD